MNLLEEIKKANLSIHTFLEQKFTNSQKTIMNKIFTANRYGQDYYSIKLNGYLIYKLFCKENKNIDPLMDKLFSLSTSELIEFIKKSKLEKLYLLDRDLFVSIWQKISKTKIFMLN